MNETTFKLSCPKCNASLKATMAFIGKRTKCPKCQTPIEVQKPDAPQSVADTDKFDPPATDKQKSFARALGIQFRDDVSRAEMSKFIDIAVERRDTERFEKLSAIDSLENDVREELRKELLAEIDAEDCRLSVATAQQFADAMSDRRFATIIIQIPWEQIEDFKHLTGVSSEVSFPEEMTQENMEDVIQSYAVTILKRDGIL